MTNRPRAWVLTADSPSILIRSEQIIEMWTFLYPSCLNQAKVPFTPEIYDAVAIAITTGFKNGLCTHFCNCNSNSFHNIEKNRNRIINRRCEWTITLYSLKTTWFLFIGSDLKAKSASDFLDALWDRDLRVPVQIQTWTLVAQVAEKKSSIYHYY